MATVIDVTVVNSAYDTSGNGGRKLVRLSNGWLVAGAFDSSSSNTKLYVDRMDGNGFVFLWQVVTNSTNRRDFSLEAVGNFVYLLRQFNAEVFCQPYDVINQVALSSSTLDSSQSDGNKCSIIRSEVGTELHAAWASKNTTYPNSFNIRYAKGTTNADGSVTWGAVEQLTTANTSGQDYTGPSVTINKDGNPCILHVYSGGTTNNVLCRVKSGGTWSSYTVNSAGSYAQSSPSAIFVPQSINGLANGRIWVAWHGMDSTDSTYYNVRYAYSDDGGTTWTAVKLTSASGTSLMFPSITVSKNNAVFIYYMAGNFSAIYRRIAPSGGGLPTWNAQETIKTGTSIGYPSTLADLSIDFTDALFIYRGDAKVGFYGTWTVTTISVTPGHLGQKTDKANLLTYAITTDGAMSTITEKVNGVTIGTKTASSGQSLIAGLTQEQWDAIRFGRYADATGGKNTLTVEMGTEKWTYTFDKRPATDADIISAVKAHKDIAEVVDPARRAKMASAIRSKGGSANDADAWETMAQAVEGIVIPKKASGTITFSGDGRNAIVTGLTFLPKTIVMKHSANPNNVLTYQADTGANVGISNTTVVTGVFTSVTETQFVIDLKSDWGIGSTGTWRAYDS